MDYVHVNPLKHALFTRVGRIEPFINEGKRAFIPRTVVVVSERNGWIVQIKFGAIYGVLQALTLRPFVVRLLGVESSVSARVLLVIRNRRVFLSLASVALRQWSTQR